MFIFLCYFYVFIFIIIGKTAHLSHSLPERFCQICLFSVYVSWMRPSGFHIFEFRNNNFLYRARSSACRPTPNLADQVPVFMSPSDSGPFIPPGIGFPFRRLLRLAGVPWGYSNPPPHRNSPVFTCFLTCLHNCM
jgi:hypothetical protein